MATIDTSLFPSATFKVDTGEAMPVTSRLNALRESQMGDIKFRQAQQEEADNMLLRQAYNAPDPVNFLAQQGRGDLVPAVKQSMFATQEAESKLKTQNLAYDKAHHERIDQLIGDVTRYTTADQANSALDSMLEKGEIDPQTHSMYRNIVVSTPWPQAKTQILGGLRTIQEQFESMQPKTNIGKLQSDYDAAIQRGDKVAAAKIKQAIDIEAGGMTEYQRAQNKMAQDRFEAEKEKGNYSPETIDYLAEIYNQTGTLPTLGLGASGVKMQILNRARELGTAGGASIGEAATNVVQAKQTKAAEQSTLKGFTSGVEARRVTANNTAINHLETMDKLVNDLANSDIRVVNKAANAFAKETGSAAPTNFDAAKQIVAAEVIKAVVQNGGGVTERQEAAEQFARANSPAQLKGVINTYKDLLGGQLQSLKQQYEFGTKRKDFDQRLTPNTRKLLTPAEETKKYSDADVDAALAKYK